MHFLTKYGQKGISPKKWIPSALSYYNYLQPYKKSEKTNDQNLKDGSTVRYS